MVLTKGHFLDELTTNKFYGIFFCKYTCINGIVISFECPFEGFCMKIQF